MIRRQLNFLPGETRPTPTIQRPRRLVFFVILALFLFIAGCITYGKLTTEAPNNPEGYDPVTLEPKAPTGILNKLKYFVFGQEVKLAGERNDRINILLLGMGGIGHDGPFLTDTMMIVSIKPSTNQVAMISIPRDLGVEIPGYGIRKINHANAYGEADKQNWGAALATEVIENTFDLDIQYYARIDFQAFKEIIDEVDGVNINVERSFSDPLFPTTDGGYQTLDFSAGTQNMDGNRALEYARSRHGSNGEGSDFARSARQQKVILALKEKVLSFGTLANPLTINNIIKSLDKHITTNMEFSDIIAMLKLGRELNTGNIIRLVLDTGPNSYLQEAFTADGAFILKPKTGNFKQISQLIENIFEAEMPKFDDTPEQTTPSYAPANIEIQNGTWRAGLAARMQKRLEDAGFAIATIGNTENRPYEQSGVFAIKPSAATDVMQGLMQELHIPIKESPPEGVLATSTTDILIILGDNFNE
jgi:LCP family protein required for cell wall assembly